MKREKNYCYYIKYRVIITYYSICHFFFDITNYYYNSFFLSIKYINLKPFVFLVIKHVN